MNEEFKSRFKNALIWTIATIAVSLVFTVLMIEAERGTNFAILGRPGEIVWWWILTVTGMGYGDIWPQTFLGKLFGGIVIFTGLLLLGIVVSEISALIKLLYEHREKGIIRIKYSGHIVIYGYTSLTAGVIKLLREHYGKKLKIVLISNDVRSNPFPSQVDFIFLNPLTESTYLEANVRNAIAVIILANDRFNDPDAYSLVIADGVARDNANVISLVELVNPTLKDLFKETYIDGFIDRKEVLTDLLEDNPSPKLVRIINKQTDLDEKLSSDKQIY